MAAVIVNLVDTMKADETVRETLENIFRYTYLSEMYYYTDYQEYLDEMMEDYQDWLDELRDSADELGKTLENEGFYWRISVKGRRLYSVELGTKTAALAYESCGSEKDGREDALVAYEKKHKLDSVLLYSEYTKSGSSISGKVTSDEAELSVRYDCSTKDRSVLGIPYGSFRISVDDVSIRLDTQAAADKHGSEHTLKVTTYGDEYVKIGFTSTDKKSTVDSYKNVKLTELRDMDDLFALASDFEDWAAELTSDLDDLMW